LNKVIAILALTLLIPLMIFISILIFTITLENPFFMQRRFMGHNQFFVIYKFKTIRKSQMKDFILNFLRSTHLDELPQLINIIKGEMNFIGPRAMDLREYEFCLSHFSVYYKKLLTKRLNTKGGIFGLSQLLGFGFHEKLKNVNFHQKKIFFDCYYVKHQNIYMNIFILIMTPFGLLKIFNNKLLILKLIKKTISKKPI
jgi:lipopolysaccharide/colanic/teichoic acid biosynthesis glycosyltransferase